MQIRLLRGLPLPPNGGLLIHPDDRFQLCKPNFFLSKTKQITLSAFSSSMREYLDKAIKAEPCAQNIVDIRLAKNDTKQLCANIKIHKTKVSEMLASSSRCQSVILE